MPMYRKPGAVEWNVHLALEYAPHGLTLSPHLGYWNVSVAEVEDLSQRQLGITKRWRAYREWGEENWEIFGNTLPSLKERMLRIEQAIWEKEEENV